MNRTKRKTTGTMTRKKRRAIIPSLNLPKEHASRHSRRTAFALQSSGFDGAANLWMLLKVYPERLAATKQN